MRGNTLLHALRAIYIGEQEETFFFLTMPYNDEEMCILVYSYEYSYMSNLYTCSHYHDVQCIPWGRSTTTT